MATGRRSSKRQKNKIPIYSSTKLKRRSATTLVDQKDKQQYKCDVCGKIYYSRYHYHNHLKQYDYTAEEVSLSIKDIECIRCEFCLRKFNGLTGLIEHLQTNHIDNKFKCCDTNFGNIDLLKNHINRLNVMFVKRHFIKDTNVNITLIQHTEKLLGVKFVAINLILQKIYKSILKFFMKVVNIILVKCVIAYLQSQMISILI